MYPIRFTSLVVAFILTIAVSSIAVSADDDSTQAWPVEVNCIPDPVLPPDEWSYPGTILMSGYAGIHGIQLDWETPHIVAFFRKDADRDYPLYGGQLSPDGNWYAAPIGEHWAEISFNNYWDVRKVRLYSMSGVSEEITFDLADYRDLYQYFPTAWSYLPIEWGNSERLIIGELSIKPFMGAVEKLPFDLSAITYTERFVSPDLTRSFGSIRFGHDSPMGGLVSLDVGLLEDSELANVVGLSWRRDSAGFMAAVKSDSQLVMYDRDGNRLESVFSLGEEVDIFHRGASGRNDLNWSPDDKQFAFTYRPQYPESRHLYIVNLDRKTVTDTCLQPMTQPVWSPDGKMLAYLANARENLKIIVVDLETWNSYDIGRQSGRYGWTNSPEMVGWRE
jgi:hypothetical protein